jgi:hypothetical protein
VGLGVDVLQVEVDGLRRQVQADGDLLDRAIATAASGPASAGKR